MIILFRPSECCPNWEFTLYYGVCRLHQNFVNMSNQDSVKYREFLAQLQRHEQIPAALNDIKNLFTFKPAGEAINTIRDVGISKIMECLNATDKSNVYLTCDVLKICFEKFESGDVVKHYTSHIMYLLRHENSCVRNLAIDEVYKAVTSNPALLPVPEYIDVFVAVAQLVIDPDISVANKAVLITSNLPFEAYPKVLDEMRIALDYNASSKCNAYEVAVKISLKSLELFNLCNEYGYIDHMVDQLHTDDVLYQFNILELLSSLAVKPYGIGYLVKQGALKQIIDLIVELPNNPLGGLLTAGYMKFIGAIAHCYPNEILDKYPALVDLIFNVFESGDQAIVPVSLDTLGFIGTSIEGKLCLAALGSKYTQAVEKVGQFIRNSSMEIKIRAIYCFASLISVEKDPEALKQGPIDHRVTLMTREWFRSLGQSSMDILFGICKTPFPDVRIAGFALLDAICQHQWGEELLARTAGFIEYLLDRSSVGSTKESKEAKYDIIKRIATSAAFDNSITTRLQTYVEQGPFYTESMLEVAMEEGN